MLSADRSAAFVARLFAVDLRSLASLRIALGGLILADLLLRARFLESVYSSDGAIQGGAACSARPIGWIHQTAASTDYSAALFALAGLFALLLLVGCFTRVATVVSLALALSLHYSCLELGDGGDELLRALLLWTCFLPAGARWSVDAWRGKQARLRGERSISSVATAALLLQFVGFYVQAGVLKSGPSWLDGSALSYVFAQEYWTRPLGVALSDYDGLIALLTHATRYFEIAGPLVLLASFARATLRMLAILSFWLFQLMLALTIELNLFPWISTAATLPFLPSRFWEVWGSRAYSDASPPPAGPGSATRSWTSEVLVSLVLGYVLLASSYHVGLVRLPAYVRLPGMMLGIAQHWDMYAPSPPQHDYAVELSLAPADEIGSTEEARRARAPEAAVERVLKSYRFKYYIEKTLTHSRRRERMRGVLAWACREWTRAPAGHASLGTARLHVTVRPIRAGPRAAPGRTFVFSRRCTRAPQGGA